jgi:hypothetical protein
MTTPTETEYHPSDINGVTQEYASFLKTWGAHCGAPKSVFQGHLNCLVQAELRAAGQDVVQYAREIATKGTRNLRAIDGLTTDLLDFLSSHDCVSAGHVGEGCPDGALLIERLMKARVVLGLDASAIAGAA